MLPKGFKDLVKRVLEEDPATSRRLPRAMDTIWRNFVWGVFLDQNRLEAEANYVYDLIDDAGLFEPSTIKRLGIKWGEKMCKIC